ncbi:MAG: DUF2786 domain-containing protein [Myxococcales bacterium]|nr:DUF2786 domain-containing protein [Myxococcales bacterium]MCB9666371.1 DUF2786 domain-containing protein [Alphaproteobacteria bacterium]
MYRPRGLDKDPDALTRRLRAMTRVRKLLRLAEDQAGQPEGRSARQRAEELLTRHGLTWAAVDSPDWVGAFDFRHRTFELGKDEAWRHTLAVCLAEYLDCVALHRARETVVETFGPEAALPQVEYAFAVYLRQLREGWREHAAALQDDGTWDALHRKQQLDAREAFCVSFVLGVKERLERDRRAELDKDPVATEEARRQRKELDAWMRKAGVRWRAMPSGVGSFDAEGYRRGMEAQIDPAMGGGGGTRRLTG